MKNINLIYCIDGFLFKEKTNKIVKEYLIKNGLNQEIKTINFSLTIDKFDLILKEIYSPHFFKTKKIIIILENWKKLKKIEKETLLNSLKFTKNIIFFWEKTNLKLNYEEIKFYSDVYKIPKITKIKIINFIKNKFIENNVSFEIEILEWLNENTFNNLFFLNNEIEKLIFFYKAKNRLLKLSEVKKIVTTIKEQKIFNLINNILNEKTKETLEIYNNFSIIKYPIMLILSMIETYLWLIKKIYVLKKRKLNYKRIALVLKRNPFFILNLEKICLKQKEEKINILIEKWLKLEYNIKRGFLTPEILFKNFLIT